MIGKVLYGYCNGYFDRDSYRDKRIEAEGVVREIDTGYVSLATFESEAEKIKYLNDPSWINPEDERDRRK